MTECEPARLAIAGPPLLVVLSGPSGAGKDAVLARLEERGLAFHHGVTATTRPRRSDERDGVNYLFLTDRQYEALLRENGFLEHADVYGYHYGVPRAPIAAAIRAGSDVILRTDVQGAATIRGLVPEAVLIFIAPPSMAEMETRLRERRQDDEESLRRRLATAAAEMRRIGEYDYLVENATGRLEETTDRVLAIVTAEKCRVGRRPPSV